MGFTLSVNKFLPLTQRLRLVLALAVFMSLGSSFAAAHIHLEENLCHWQQQDDCDESISSPQYDDPCLNCQFSDQQQALLHDLQHAPKQVQQQHLAPYFLATPRAPPATPYRSRAPPLTL